MLTSFDENVKYPRYSLNLIPLKKPAVQWSVANMVPGTSKAWWGEGRRAQSSQHRLPSGSLSVSGGRMQSQGLCVAKGSKF